VSKLLMAMLLLGLAACTAYEQQSPITSGEVRDGKAGEIIVALRSHRFDDFGEYDD